MEKEITKITKSIQHSKIAIFLIVGFLFLLTYLLLIVANQASNKELSYTYQSKATENINSKPKYSERTNLTGEQLFTALHSQEKEILIEDLPSLGITQEELDRATTITSNNCKFAVFPGDNKSGDNIVCCKNPEGDTIQCPKEDSCNYSALIICRSPYPEAFTIEYPYCVYPEHWQWIASSLCCDSTWLARRFYLNNEKSLCDAACQRANQTNCVPGVEAGQYGWVCKDLYITPAIPTGGAMQPLPMNP